MKYKVQANPRGGTCYQFVEAESQEEAVEKAWDNPDGWKSATPKTRKDWNIKAYER